MLLLLKGAIAQPLQHTNVFPFQTRIHNHAPCVIQLSNGDLFLAYYTGLGERTSDDVRVVGHRLSKGDSIWSPRIQLADTPNYPDCNPAVFQSPQGQLWLWYPTILDNNWEGALLKFKVSSDYLGPGQPRWNREGVAHITPVDFEQHLKKAAVSQGFNKFTDKVPNWNQIYQVVTTRAKQLLFQRLGWLPRVKPTILKSGRWLLPLYSDTFSASLAYYTDDKGTTWHTSQPIVGFGNVQPVFVQRKDGTVVAFMRDNGPFRRIRKAQSKDGHSWSQVDSIQLPNPGAGVDCICLLSGAWLMIYNDLQDGRWSLAAGISDDEGVTWPFKRQLVRDENGKDFYQYPSVVQTKDGEIHVLFSEGKGQASTISHVRTTEGWLRGQTVHSYKHEAAGLRAAPL